MSVSLLCSKVGTKKRWVEVSSKQNYTCDALGVRAPSSSSSCQVGDTGPGGGGVFYVASTAFTAAGTTCNTACRYLEAAPNTWNGGVVDPRSIWATAVGMADSLIFGGKSDWFLPSKNQLNEMYKNKNWGCCESSVGHFAGYGYWSSTEDSRLREWAWLQYIDSNGFEGISLKDKNFSVRPVRAF